MLSNLKSATWLLKLKGARFFAMDPAGNGILEVTGSKNGVARITVEASNPAPVVIGGIVSVIGLLWLAGMAIRFGVTRRRRRAAEIA